jgi:hypothetical protein
MNLNVTKKNLPLELFYLLELYEILLILSSLALFIQFTYRIFMKHMSRTDIYGCLNLEGANGEQQRVRLSIRLSIRAFSYAMRKKV